MPEWSTFIGVKRIILDMGRGLMIEVKDERDRRTKEGEVRNSDGG